MRKGTSAVRAKVFATTTTTTTTTTTGNHPPTLLPTHAREQKAFRTDLRRLRQVSATLAHAVSEEATRAVGSLSEPFVAEVGVHVDKLQALLKGIQKGPFSPARRIPGDRSSAASTPGSSPGVTSPSSVASPVGSVASPSTPAGRSAAGGRAAIGLPRLAANGRCFLVGSWVWLFCFVFVCLFFFCLFPGLWVIAICFPASLVQRRHRQQTRRLEAAGIPCPPTCRRRDEHRGARLSEIGRWSAQPARCLLSAAADNAVLTGATHSSRPLRG